MTYTRRRPADRTRSLCIDELCDGPKRGPRAQKVPMGHSVLMRIASLPETTIGSQPQFYTTPLPGNGVNTPKLSRQLPADRHSVPFATKRQVSSPLRDRELYASVNHACKIQETTNGCRGRFGRKTWTHQQIIIAWRFEEHVQINESAAAERSRQNQAQIASDQKAEINLSFENLRHRSWEVPTRRENPKPIPAI